MDTAKDNKKDDKPTQQSNLAMVNELNKAIDAIISTHLALGSKNSRIKLISLKFKLESTQQPADAHSTKSRERTILPVDADTRSDSSDDCLEWVTNEDGTTECKKRKRRR
jgi:hypothetical protein